MVRGVSAVHVTFAGSMPGSPLISPGKPSASKGAARTAAHITGIIKRSRRMRVARSGRWRFIARHGLPAVLPAW